MSEGLSTYGDNNRIVDIRLTTLYTARYDSTSQSAPYWEYTRLRTKSYRYVGLTDAACDACVSAMQSLYNRRMYNWKWDGSRWAQDKSTTGTYSTHVAQITPRREDGGTWTVQVDVDEMVYLYLNYAASETQLPLLFANAGLDFGYDGD